MEFVWIALMMSVIISSSSVEQYDIEQPLFDDESADDFKISENIHKRNVKRDHPIGVTEITNWPQNSVIIGQVTGVAVDGKGLVYIFHRADRIWDADTFLSNNQYAGREIGPISRPTVFVLKPDGGPAQIKWGGNMFYMPHGITIDKYLNLWLTDVALHQVFKFAPISTNPTKPLLTLGKAFVPGNDDSTFCKPSSVAVALSGEFYVADGYCNSRIIKYAADGSRLLQWGRSTLNAGDFLPVKLSPYELSVPHDITIAEDKSLVCVADRENGRVQCFNMRNGTFAFEVSSTLIGSRIFSVSYIPSKGGLLFMLNGPELTPGVPVQVTVVNSTSMQIVQQIQPYDGLFNSPHDVTISPDGRYMYVAELQPNRIWQFKLDGLETDAGYFVTDPVSGKYTSQMPFSGPHSSLLFVAGVIMMAVMLFGGTMIVIVMMFSRRRSHACTSDCGKRHWRRRGDRERGFKLINILGPSREEEEGFIQLKTVDSDEDDDDLMDASYLRTTDA